MVASLKYRRTMAYVKIKKISRLKPLDSSLWLRRHIAEWEKLKAGEVILVPEEELLNLGGIKVLGRVPTEKKVKTIERDNDQVE